MKFYMPQNLSEYTQKIELTIEKAVSQRNKQIGIDNIHTILW